MPKSRAKVSEELVAGAFADAGFETYIPPKAKYRNQDVFEEFDVLAFRPGHLWLVQVKTNTVRSINEWFTDTEPYEDGLKDARVAYAVVHADHDPDAVRFAVSASDGYEWAVDERQDDVPAEGQGVIEWLQERGGA